VSVWEGDQLGRRRGGRGRGRGRGRGILVFWCFEIHGGVNQSLAGLVLVREAENGTCTRL
jgi:hypothetical protein